MAALTAIYIAFGQWGTYECGSDARIQHSSFRWNTISPSAFLQNILRSYFFRVVFLTLLKFYYFACHTWILISAASIHSAQKCIICWHINIRECIDGRRNVIHMRACGNSEYFRMHSLVKPMERKKKVVMQFINSISECTQALIQWCNYTNGNKINSTSGNSAAKILLCSRPDIEHIYFIRHYISTWFAWPSSGHMFGNISRTAKKGTTLHRLRWIGDVDMMCNDKFEPTDAWKLDSILCENGEWRMMVSLWYIPEILNQNNSDYYILQKFTTAYKQIDERLLWLW